MIDRRIKFRHVQCFVEIAREGSLKRAGEILLLTQPAVSKTLKELEEILGCTLLLRSRSGVELTRDGAVFLRFAQMSIAALQQGINGLAQGQTQEALNVGVLPSVAARLIPDVVTLFARAAPDVTLRIADGPHGYLTERLKLGALDLVLGRMGDHDQMGGVTFTRLYQEQVIFVVRPGHPLVSEPLLSKVAHWPVVYPPVGSAIRPGVDRFMVEHGIDALPRQIETVSGAFGRVYVRDSDAVWIISEGVVAREIAAGVLCRLPFDTDTTLGPIGVMTREDWTQTAPARLFRAALQQVIEETDGLVR